MMKLFNTIVLCSI